MSFLNKEVVQRFYTYIDNLVEKNFLLNAANGKTQTLKSYSDDDLHETINQIIASVDLYSPPGLAGFICDELAKIEKRELRELRPVSALTLISAACRNRQGFNTKKLNLMFLASAETAYGKEAHQEFIKEILLRTGSQNIMCTTPRSDKAFYTELAKTGGSLYILDEAHSFFDSATSCKASSYQADMIKMILELNTSGLLLFPENIKKEILNEFNSLIKNLNKKDALDHDEADELKYLNLAGKWVKNGWSKPYVGFIGFATPDNLERIISPQHIASGLLGRFIYLRSSGKAGELTNDPFLNQQPEARISEDLVALFKQINESDDAITLAPDAQHLLSLVLKYLELDSVRNHRKLGGLYRRGIERISQISSLLAMDTGVITGEMASYATAMFLEHVKVCEEALNRASAGHDENILDRAHAVVLDILKSAPQTKGLVANQLVRRSADIRKKRETHEKYEYVVLNKLVEAKNLVEKDGKYALPV